MAYLSTNGQFPALGNAIWGKDSYLPGIKKVVGGVLAADITHSKCGQKMLCDEMAPEVSITAYVKLNCIVSRVYIMYDIKQSLEDLILINYT